MKDLAAAMRAAGNPDRVRILEVLRQSRANRRTALTITDIARATELSRFSASRHLAVLVEARLVHCAVNGSSRLHSLCVDTFEMIEDWVIEFTVPLPDGAGARVL